MDKHERTLVAFEMISPILAEWISSLSIYEREIIILEAYIQQKLNVVKDLKEV